jgi:hypothetical protein
MESQNSSETIRKERLGEPHVLLHRAPNGNCTLWALDTVLEAAKFPPDDGLVVISATTLNADDPLVADHLRDAGPGDVVSFHLVDGGALQIRKHAITDEARHAIRRVLSSKLRMV